MKKSLLIALAVMLVLSFASSAMAAQLFLNDSSRTILNNVYYYDETPSKFVYGSITTPTAYTAGFEYPYGIYLPDAGNPAAYRIHSSYAKNTDACASCHSTHTAVGNNLLQWYTTYEACMACHDGTVSTTYDVANGKIATTGKPAMGGAFATGASASNHNVTGSVNMNAAPGGSFASLTDGKTWTNAFGCESCHSPHGNGGNARILHPNPNNVNKTATYKVSTAGYVYENTDTEANRVYILNTYPTIPVIKVNGGAAVGAYIKNVSGVSVVYTSGNVEADATYSVDGTPALQVTMEISNYLAAGETVKHRSGMNPFCGACHTDYNTEGLGHTSDMETGTYTLAHRHQVGGAPHYNNVTNLNRAGMVLEGPDANGKLECLTCHVAHGVNYDYWTRTVGEDSTTISQDYLTNAELVELAGTSALKRLPNMGTCEACHQKGEANKGYLNNVASAGVSALDVVAKTNEFYIGQDATTLNLNWVGAAKCAGCHKAKFDNWKTTKHYSNTRASNFSGAAGCSYTNGSDSAELNYTGQAPNTNPDVTVNGLPASYPQYGDAKYISCHAVGTWAMGNPTKASGSSFYYVDGVDRGLDSSVTCEACHGSGAQHVLNPTTANINNPIKTIDNSSLTAAQKFEAKIIFCAKCHEKTRKVSAALTDASDLFTGDTAGGGSEYAQSKHYLQQEASCDTCHDVHEKRAVSPTNNLFPTSEDEIAEALVLPYYQLCASCHGSTVIGPITSTMGKASDRHLSNHAFVDGFTGKTAASATITSAVYTTTAASNTKDRSATVTLAVYDAGSTLIETTSYAGTYSLVAPALATTESYKFNPLSGQILFVKNKTLTPGNYTVTYKNIKTPSVTASITHVVNP